MKALVFHKDLDGFFTAAYFYKEMLMGKIKNLDIIPIEYSNNYEKYKKYSKYYIFDFNINIGKEKTVVFLDHHKTNEDLKNFKSKNLILFKIMEKPSCLQVLNDLDIVNINSRDLKYVNMVDSANYDFKVTPKEDIILPNLETELGYYILLNFLLKKDKNLAYSLMFDKIFKIDEIYHYITTNKIKFIQPKKYIEDKKEFIELILNKSNELITDIGNISIVFLKNFSPFMFKGYDANVFGYFKPLTKYTAILSEFDEIKIQIRKNIFYNGKEDQNKLFSLASKFTDNIGGHDTIVNIRFDSIEEALKLLSDLSDIL